ncbi:MAG TPA: M20/M25/M40 family metallo-hydrolase [Kofleriaceae bacterium]|nr:M20/M25/M40 family metallo-hydrolase [Kofleriaceae bacterium]
MPRADAGSAASCIAGDPFAPETLAATIRALASPELDGRVPGSAGDRTARTLIAERFACLGLAPAGDDKAFTQAFTAEGVGTANVIGFIRGADEVIGDEIILIGAHHDHLGDGHLGANDNASGVAALLAIAQEMRQRAPRRTIAFATWGAEEQGMLGSRYFVAHPPDALPLGKIVQYINLDMVGSHSSKGFVAAMGTFAKQPSRRLLATLERRYPKLRVGLGGRASRSDHTPFCARGIPYVFFWTPDARCYHEVCDTPARIDLPRMADIAALAGDLAWSLAQSEADLAASRARLGCGQ